MSLGLYDTLQYINKQIKNICCKLKLIEELEGIPGPPGPPGPAGGFGPYGSWFSTEDQINTLDGILPMTVNNTDFANDVLIDGITNSKITFVKAGKYNIQFSAQFHHRPGAGSGKEVSIWFAKNGTAIPDSNTKVSMDTNTPFKVPAWNFFVDAAAGDYYQIMWTTNNVSIVIEHEAATAIHPATPSVIITVNQVG